MTSTETYVPLATRRLEWLTKTTATLSPDMTGTEYFEMLGRIRRQASILGGSEKWDRVLRAIDVMLDKETAPRFIVLVALEKFAEAVQFPRV